MMLHRQLTVEPDLENTYDVSTVDGCLSHKGQTGSLHASSQHQINCHFVGFSCSLSEENNAVGSLTDRRVSMTGCRPVKVTDWAVVIGLSVICTQAVLYSEDVGRTFCV